MSNESKIENEHPPTKLTFFFSSQDQSCDIRERMTTLPWLVQELGYTFQFEMPTVHCQYEKPKTKTEKYLNWRGKEREREVTITPNNPPFYHYLQFSKELSEEELKFWRIFKLGYLTRHWCPSIRN